MAKLTDLPCELLIELLLYSVNGSLATVCRWTYFCLRRPTPRLCYKFARELGGWRKAATISACLRHRFLSPEVLDQIKKNKGELHLKTKRKKNRDSSTGDRIVKLEDIKIPSRLFMYEPDGRMPVNKRIAAAGLKRKRDDAGEHKGSKSALHTGSSNACGINVNQRRFDIVKKLLSLKVSIKGSKGNTGLLLAAKAGNLPLVRMLLRHDADVTAGGENKALLMAVVGGHLLVVKYLVRAGAPATSLALRYAVQKKHLVIASWLMKKGAAPDMVTIKLLDSL